MLRFAAFLLFLLAPLCSAEDVTQWIIPPQPGQITQNIHLVVDFSGSMGAEKVAAAISKTLEIVSQSVDEVNIRVTVFGNTFETWPGIPNEKQPGWTALPDGNAIKALDEWLKTVSIDNGATQLRQPLFIATSEKIQKTVIVISDLFFDSPDCIVEGMDYSSSTIGFIGLYASENTTDYIRGYVEKVGGFFCNIVHGDN